MPVVLVEEESDRLSFQSMDELDSFEADDNLFDPVPEISYRPAVPAIEILPESKANDELDIIAPLLRQKRTERAVSKPAG